MIMSLAQVHAVAYYYEYKPQLDEEMRQRRVKDAEVKEKQVGVGTRRVY